MNNLNNNNSFKHHIKESLSNYIGFPIDSIFDTPHNDFAIFGGAVRDSIAKKEIHDLDILCLPNSFKHLLLFFEEEGFTKVRVDYDIENLYKGLRIIHEPITLQKGNAKVQLIRPYVHKFNSTIKPDDVTDATMMVHLYKVLMNVDLSHCGVYYMNGQVKESVKGAIEDCINGTFKIMNSAIMLNRNRLNDRVFKFEGRGWKLTNAFSKFNNNNYEPDLDEHLLIN